MPEKSPMDVLFASTNNHKLDEFRRLFADSRVTIQSPSELGLQPLPVAETGNTFMDNARLKAHAYLEAYRIPVLADDSGICVDALAGAPGVRSHRFGTPDLDDDGRVRYMLDQLRTVGDPYRGAHYVCALVLVLPDNRSIAGEGYCYGSITRQIQAGPTGFGYDPIFRPRGADRTVAQMTPEQKDALSHRGRAVRTLLAAAVRAGALSGTL
jgi:XTP/dITP diphosphohydrolase